MLVDALVADKELPRLCPGFDTVQDKIRRAQKFALAQDFALAADGLVANRTEMAHIAPFCRLPYPITWFEFAQSARTHWLNAPLHYPAFQGKPEAVGFLCIAKDDSLTRWDTILCWALKPGENKFGSNRLNASILSVAYDLSKSSDDMKDYAKAVLAPFTNISFGMIDANDSTVISELARIMESDWAGEVQYLLAILGLLNARNASETVSVNLTKLNRSRQRSGKLPFFEHKMLKIRALHKPSLIPGMPLQGSKRSAEIRAAFVIGHFKRRKTGLFWWSPHLRGRLSQGFVQKDYVVTT